MKTIQIRIKKEEFGKYSDSVQLVVIANAICNQCKEPEIQKEIAEIDSNYNMGFITGNEWRNQIIDAATHFYHKLEFVYDNN